LVSVRAGPHHAGSTTDNTSEDDDADIQRAKSLVQLHYDVKENHKRGGLGQGLEEARKQVMKIAMESNPELGK
jgi:hypothetical protein